MIAMVLALGLATADPFPAQAAAGGQVAAASETGTPAREDAALALVRLAVTQEDVAGAAVLERSRNELEQLLRADRRLASLDRRAPGTVAAVIAATVPIVLESARIRLPVLHRRLAALYARRLSADDIVAVTAFLASDPGARYADALRTNQVQTATLASMLRSPSRTPNRAGLAADREQTRAIALGSLDAETRMVVDRVRAGASHVAFERLDPDATEIFVDWAGDYLPGERARIEQASSAAIEKHLAGQAGDKSK